MSPINCPLAFEGACDEPIACHHYSDNKCTYFYMLPPKPLSEILTVEERLDKLEKVFEDIEMRVPFRAMTSLRRNMDNLKGQMIHTENKLNDHLDEPKKKARKRTGAVET